MRSCHGYQSNRGNDVKFENELKKKKSVKIMKHVRSLCA